MKKYESFWPLPQQRDGIYERSLLTSNNAKNLHSR